MISEVDIWRAANRLIRRHGAKAELEVAKRPDLMLDCGDDKGRGVWRPIRRDDRGATGTSQSKPN
jgi:hypothetical protein